MAQLSNREAMASFLLRFGLAAVFLYAAISSLLNPENWIGFFPEFLRVEWVMVLFSLYQITLSLWLLSGRRAFDAANVSSITTFLIIIFNLTVLDVVFRDIAIFFMAVALAVLTKKKKD